MCRYESSHHSCVDTRDLEEHSQDCASGHSFKLLSCWSPWTVFSTFLFPEMLLLLMMLFVVGDVIVDVIVDDAVVDDDAVDDVCWWWCYCWWCCYFNSQSMGACFTCQVSLVSSGLDYLLRLTLLHSAYIWFLVRIGVSGIGWPIPPNCKSGGNRTFKNFLLHKNEETDKNQLKSVRSCSNLGDCIEAS